jgi:hypothetical protein
LCSYRLRDASSSRVRKSTEFHGPIFLCRIPDIKSECRAQLWKLLHISPYHFSQKCCSIHTRIRIRIFPCTMPTRAVAAARLFNYP